MQVSQSTYQLRPGNGRSGIDRDALMMCLQRGQRNRLSTSTVIGIEGLRRHARVVGSPSVHTMHCLPGAMDVCYLSWRHSARLRSSAGRVQGSGSSQARSLHGGSWLVSMCTMLGTLKRRARMQCLAVKLGSVALVRAPGRQGFAGTWSCGSVTAAAERSLHLLSVLPPCFSQGLCGHGRAAPCLGRESSG